ncbi:hypothetical protein B0H16DRAFT_1504900 [Mycena metata]|uniref:Uncharacterized protein n=1 Tax=Mycena metata TaxID=1033252 RepID=A0AAD7K554_9AGAR|nr:hypothetical protein B0H16DRAFT_1504900 [Mycena metata]
MTFTSAGDQATTTFKLLISSITRHLVCILSCSFLVVSANQSGGFERRSPVNREDQHDDGYNQQGGYAPGDGGSENQPANKNAQANDDAAAERIISKRYEKRDGYDDGYGYGNNNGGYSSGSYGGGYNGGEHTGENQHHDGAASSQQPQRDRSRILLAISRADRRRGLSVDRANHRDHDHHSGDDHGYLYDDVNGDRHHHIHHGHYHPSRPAPKKKAWSATRTYNSSACRHKRDMCPHWLQRFNATEVSFACSELVMPQTILPRPRSIRPTTTTTATLTVSSTQPHLSQPPRPNAPPPR